MPGQTNQLANCSRNRPLLAQVVSIARAEFAPATARNRVDADTPDCFESVIRPLRKRHTGGASDPIPPVLRTRIFVGCAPQRNGFDSNNQLVRSEVVRSRILRAHGATGSANRTFLQANS